MSAKVTRTGTAAVQDHAEVDAINSTLSDFHRNNIVQLKWPMSASSLAIMPAFHLTPL
jgi:hypothetical protein